MPMDDNMDMGMPPMDDNPIPEPPAPEPPADEPPMGGPESGEEMDSEENETPEGGNSEIDSLFDKLNTEKQAAVIKYAKSMIDDVEDKDNEDKGDGMPMEGRKHLSKMINEIINNILSDEETNDNEDRADNKIRNKRITSSNPFISKR